MGVLIEVAELAAALAGPQPPRVLDVRWYLTGRDGRDDYEQEHLPTAHWVDLDRELAGPAGPDGRHPLPDPLVFQNAMRRVGLQPDEPLVVMDDGSLMGAARLWWLLADCGVATKVVHGGLAAWRAAGLPVISGPTPAIEPSTIVLQPGRLPRVSTDQVEQRQARGQARLWDVRAPERYTGATEPIDPVAGHIPGARNLPSAQAFAEGRLRPSSQLREHFAEVQAGDVVYCGSGITATQTLLALAIAGIPDVVLYPGSWSAWISDRRRPVAQHGAGRD